MSRELRTAAEHIRQIRESVSGKECPPLPSDTLFARVVLDALMSPSEAAIKAGDAAMKGMPILGDERYHTLATGFVAMVRYMLDGE